MLVENKDGISFTLLIFGFLKRQNGFRRVAAHVEADLKAFLFPPGVKSLHLFQHVAIGTIR